MPNTIKTNTSPNKSNTSVNLLTILMLVILPVVGIVLVWVVSKWHMAWRVIATILGAIWGIASFVLLLILFYNNGSIQPLLNQDQMAASYLEERYGEEFTIVRSRSSDQLGGAVTFDKWASPKADPSVEFNVYKCLARCNPEYKEVTYFTDTYPKHLWDKDATREAQDLKTERTPGKLSVVILGDTSSSDIFDTSGKLLHYGDLSNQTRAELGYGLRYSEALASLSDADKQRLAAEISRLWDAIKNNSAKSVSLEVVIKVPSRKENARPLWTDTIRLEFSQENPPVQQDVIKSLE